MKVNRAQILFRGLTHACPNCGARTLFERGRLFRVNRTCSACGFGVERENDEGFFLGSMSLNFGVTIVCFEVPVILLWYHHILDGTVAEIAAGVGALAFPLLFYRSSRSWWLMNYYLLLPHHLPANGGKGRAGEDDNV